MTASSNKLNEYSSEKFQLRLKETEQTINGKNVVIDMMREQFKKLEELYKVTLDKTERLRFKHCTTEQELSNYKDICQKLEEANQKFLLEREKWKNDRATEIVISNDDVNKWKIQHEQVLTKLRKMENSAALMKELIANPSCYCIDSASPQKPENLYCKDGACSTDSNTYTSNVVESLKSQLTLKNQEIENLKSLINNQLKQELDQLNEIIINLREDNEEMKNVLDEKNRSLTKCISDIDYGHEEIKKLSRCMEETVEEKEHYKMQVKCQNGEINKMKQALKEHENCQIKCSQMEKQISVLTETINTLLEENKIKEENICDKLSKTSKQIEDCKHEVESKTKDLKEGNSFYECTINELRRKLSEMGHVKEVSENENNSLKIKISEQNMKLELMMNLLESYKCSNDGKVDKSTSTIVSGDDIDNLNKTVSDLNENIIKNAKEVRDCNYAYEELENLKIVNREYQNIISNLKEEVSKIDSDRKALKDQNTSMKMVIKDLNEKLVTAADGRIECESAFKKKILSLETEKAELRNTLKSITTGNENKVQTLKEENTSLKKEIVELKKKLESMANDMKECERKLQTKIVEFEAINNEREQTVQLVNEKLATLKQQTEGDESKIIKLTENTVKLTSEKEALAIENNSLKEKVKEAIYEVKCVSEREKNLLSENSKLVNRIKELERNLDYASTKRNELSLETNTLIEEKDKLSEGLQEINEKLAEKVESLIEKLAKLEGENTEYKNSLDNLSICLEDSKCENQSLSFENNNLKGEITNLTDSIGKISRAVEECQTSLKKQLSNLETENVQQKTELNNLQASVNKVESEKEILSVENERLTNNINELNKRISEVSKDKEVCEQQMQKKIAVLEEKSVQQNTTLHALEEHIIATKVNERLTAVEIAKLKNHSLTIENEKDNLRQQLDNVQTSIKKLVEENINLSESNKKLQENLITVHKKFTEKSSELECIQNQRSSNEKKLQYELTVLMEQHEKLKQGNILIESAKKQLLNEMSILKQVLEKSENENKRIRKENGDIKNILDNINVDLVKDNILQYENQIKALKEDINKLKQENKEIEYRNKQLHKQVSNYQNKLGEIKEVNTALESNNTELRQEINKYKVKLGLKDEFKSCECDKKDKENASNLLSQVKRIEEMNNRIQALSLENSQKQCVINTLNQCIERGHKTLGECENELKHFQCELQVLQQENNKLQTKNDELVQELDVLKKCVSTSTCEANRKLKENANLKEKVVSLRNSIAQTEEEREPKYDSKVQQELLSLKKEYAKLKELYTLQQKELDQLKSECDCGQTEAYSCGCESIMNELECRNAEYESLKKEYEDLKKSQEAQIKVYNREIEKLQKEGKRGKTSGIYSRSTITELKTPKETEMLFKLQDQNQQIKKLQEKCEGNCAESCRLHRYIECLYEDNRALKNAINTLIAKLENKINEVKEHKEKSPCAYLLASEIMQSLSEFDMRENSEQMESVEKCNCMSIITSTYNNNDTEGNERKGKTKYPVSDNANSCYVTSKYSTGTVYEQCSAYSGMKCCAMHMIGGSMQKKENDFTVPKTYSQVKFDVSKASSEKSIKFTYSASCCNTDSTYSLKMKCIQGEKNTQALHQLKMDLSHLTNQISKDTVISEYDINLDELQDQLNVTKKIEDEVEQLKYELFARKSGLLTCTKIEDVRNSRSQRFSSDRNTVLSDLESVVKEKILDDEAKLKNRCLKLEEHLKSKEEYIKQKLEDKKP